MLQLGCARSAWEQSAPSRRDRSRGVRLCVAHALVMAHQAIRSPYTPRPTSCHSASTTAWPPPAATSAVSGVGARSVERTPGPPRTNARSTSAQVSKGGARVAGSIPRRAAHWFAVAPARLLQLAEGLSRHWVPVSDAELGCRTGLLDRLESRRSDGNRVRINKEKESQ